MRNNLTRIPNCPRGKPAQGDVAQTFLSGGSRDFPVPCFLSGTGDWKVATTRRLESLRYQRITSRLRNSGLIFLLVIAILGTKMMALAL